MSLSSLSVRNPVPVNLLMWVVILAGVYCWFQLIREFFPSFDAEQIIITVPYPGAPPEDVEKSVTRRIEREVETIDDVEEVESKVFEGLTIVQLTLEEGADRERVLNDVRGQIDKVKPDLPGGTEDPEIDEARPTIPVIGVVIHGGVDEESLREVTKDVRDDLLDLPDVSRVLISGMRNREVWAEVRPEKLEEHSLTFEEVGQAIARANLDLPGGQLKSARGNVQVRSLGEQDQAREIERLAVRARPDGLTVRLRDVARVRDTFEDRVERGRFNGVPATLITVFKTPEQDALEIASEVKEYVASEPTRLGGALQLDVTSDLARFIEQRLDLMKRNAQIGLVLVLIALAVFLEVRVAFWVAVGLPISFLGTFVLMKMAGATINLISLFGLIVVLGLIVDDAIVIGENFFKKLEKGLSPARAAVEGTREVAVPVLAAVITTMAAFLPLMFISGRIGQFLGVLPIVVVAALAVSLVEAFIILPCHLGHLRHRPASRGGLLASLERLRPKRLLDEWLPRWYERSLRFVLRWRYPAMAAAFAVSAAAGGLLAGGFVKFVLIQETDAETLSIELEMAAGTSEEGTLATIQDLEQIALDLPETASVFSVLGSGFSDRGLLTPADPATLGQLVVELTPAEAREEQGQRTSQDITTELRRLTDETPGVARLSVRARGGGPAGRDIEVRIRAEDLASLRGAVQRVRSQLQGYQGVSDVEDNLTEGKMEVRLALKDSARLLGITTSDLARQVRHALFGFEAQELQGEDEEVKVRAVLPEFARRDIEDLGRLRIATPDGGRVPLEEVAELTTARGYAQLARVDGKRAITVTAEVDDQEANAEEVTASLARDLRDLGDRFPGASYSFEGQKKEARESLGSLKIGFPVALLLIYSIIAVLFRSYFQPFVVMAAIPYSLVGAIVGHFVMGFPFTILSMIGGVALAGIVVNDSLILVNHINRQRREGMGTIDAIVAGGRARLRPILLTSITTIFGIGPLMLERSFQAQFLIPMAISIVFGLAFATVLTLVLLPTLYLVFEDLRASVRWLFTGTFSRTLVEPEAVRTLDDESALKRV